MTTVTAPDRSTLDRYGRERIGDNLWYVHPTTGERFISVTSVLDGLDDEMLSEFWAPEQAALAASENLPKLVRASMTAPCGNTPKGWRRTPECQSGEDGHDPRIQCSQCPCGQCMPCLVVWLRDEPYRQRREALGRGSMVHEWIERWVLSGGRDMINLAEQYQPYIDAFMRFVEDFGLSPESWEMAEAKVMHRSHGWAGTLDGAIRFDATASKAARELCERIGLARPLLVNDWHTREREEPRFPGTKALQVGVYRRAEAILMPDGTEEPMPATDGGIIVQLRPDGYGYRPILTDDEDYERGFLDRLASKRWALRRLDVLASVWHYPRDDYGRAQTDQGRVTTFPRKPIPGLPAEPPPSFGEPEANEAAKQELIRAGLVRDPAKPKKRAAAASKSRGRAKATATVEQPALPEPQGPSKLERVTLTGAAARSFAAHGQRAPHPDSPSKDWIPF